jgi:hypothetical protein
MTTNLITSDPSAAGDSLMLGQSAGVMAGMRTLLLTQLSLILYSTRAGARWLT